MNNKTNKIGQKTRTTIINLKESRHLYILLTKDLGNVLNLDLSAWTLDTEMKYSTWATL